MQQVESKSESGWKAGFNYKLFIHLQDICQVTTLSSQLANISRLVLTAKCVHIRFDEVHFGNCILQ